jgi:hypothetical protein
MGLRAFTVYVLVGVLLGCPFPCLAEAAAGVGCLNRDGHGGDRCVSCPPGEEQPGPDEPDQGGTCLCHGAVAERQTPPPAPDSQFVSVLSADSLLGRPALTLFKANASPDLSACDFGSVYSGRMVRALIESFLI